MSDLIEREAAIEALKAHEDYKGYIVGDYEVILSNEVPAAQPKKGKWVKDRLVSTSGGSYGVYRCSLCSRAYQDVGYGFNYCPNCGAEMEEEDV